jgi:septum formation protein
MVDASTSTARAPSLVLASTSVYRRALLARLRVPFSVLACTVDESERAGESPRQTCERLALAKALAGAQRAAALHPEAVVIGSDQVADVDGQALSKPLTHERALAQLQAMRGRTIDFHTAVAVVRTTDKHGAMHVVQQAQGVVTVRVHFRAMADTQLERYLRIEQPYDCAGSAKCEGLGIALLEAIDSTDPTALEGLPLITLTHLLQAVGYNVLDHAQ